MPMDASRSFRLLALLLSVSLWLLPLWPALAADPLQARADSLVALWTPTSKLSQMFAPSFLAKLPEGQLRQIAKDLQDRYGPCTRVRVVKTSSANAATLEWTFAKGYRAEGSLTLQAEEPHAITGLWIGQVLPDQPTWTRLVSHLQELPGSTSLGVYRLPAQGNPVPLVESHSTRPLAIGSAFKLYVLGELIAQIQAGKRHWTDLVTLRSSTRSLPSGLLQDWPTGAPLTLHTLGGLMISHSDNTATDTLMALLGRDRLAVSLQAMGNAHASQNAPFLSTSEMFRLKGDPAGKAADAYLGLKAADRTRFLDQDLPRIALESLDFPLQPTRIDSLEWFASTEDLARAMQWILRQTEHGETAKARELLAINPGLPAFHEAFSYVGFKGGSEPGVLNLTFMLQTKQGNWYAVAATWNDPQAPVDESRLVDLLASVVPLLKDR